MVQNEGNTQNYSDGKVDWQKQIKLFKNRQSDWHGSGDCSQAICKYQIKDAHKKTIRKQERKLIQFECEFPTWLLAEFD